MEQIVNSSPDIFIFFFNDSTCVLFFVSLERHLKNYSDRKINHITFCVIVKVVENVSKTEQRAPVCVISDCLILHTTHACHMFIDVIGYDHNAWCMTCGN